MEIKWRLHQNKHNYNVSDAGIFASSVSDEPELRKKNAEPLKLFLKNPSWVFCAILLPKVLPDGRRGLYIQECDIRQKPSLL